MRRKRLYESAGNRLHAYVCKKCSHEWQGDEHDFVCPRGVTYADDGGVDFFTEEELCGACNKRTQHDGANCRGLFCNEWPSRKVKPSLARRVAWWAFVVGSLYMVAAFMAFQFRYPELTQTQAFLRFFDAMAWR